MTLRLALGTSLALLIGIATAAAAPPPPAPADAALAAAVQGKQRSPAFRERDKARHPAALLQFFGVRPDMTVVEVLPGGGYWTEILAPYLRDHGRLVEATTPTTVASPFMKRMAERFYQKLAADPALYGKVETEPFELPAYMPLGAPASADMVVTFRNMHDLIFANVHGVITDIMMRRFFRSAYEVLKPGGILGIEAHRANPDMPPAQSFKLGRLPQAFIIHEAEEAGFRLAGTSEINANPKDPRTMPVWELPPSLRVEGADRAKNAAIGEADNMELKFIRPRG